MLSDDLRNPFENASECEPTEPKAAASSTLLGLAQQIESDREEVRSHRDDTERRHREVHAAVMAGQG